MPGEATAVAIPNTNRTAKHAVTAPKSRVIRRSRAFTHTDPTASSGKAEYNRYRLSDSRVGTDFEREG
jgi:hypothetical protein